MGAQVFVLVVPIRPKEPANILFFFAVEVSHAPLRFFAKDHAPKNMSSMFFTLDTSHFEMSRLNDSAKANMPNIVVTLDTSHLEMSLLNEVAEENIPSMVVTLDTSHLEMSLLNDFA